MTRKRNRFTLVLRITTAGLLALELLLLALGAIGGTRFQNAPGPAVAIALISVLIIVAAIAILLDLRRPKSRSIQVIVVGVALALTVRAHLATYLHRAQWPGQPRLAALESPVLVPFLQDLAAAQEQYRLRSGRYSTSVDSLSQWIRQPPGSVVNLVVHQAQGWSGQASLAGMTCSIWVRDSTLRSRAAQPEGHPTCRTPERRGLPELIPSVVAAAPSRVTTFGDADVSGTWPQHRFDAHRTGVSADSAVSGHSWTARVSGPLRAPVSIAGNQVFVGAHGNGELVALTLDSGKLGFRLRAPNWVHHEPAISSELFVVGFGNNEALGQHWGGSPPSGVVAYDRRTGFERWRFYTKGSVMTVPLIADSVVAVATEGPDVVGLRLRDGAELWRTAVPHQTAMGNAMLVDNLMIFGAEAASACALEVKTGVLRYCTRLNDKCEGNCWGAGHASAALAGDVALQVYESDKVNLINQLIAKVKLAIGFPPVARAVAPEADTGEQILVAFDWRDGRVRWRSSLGKGSLFPPGHIAGTPTIVDSVAFIPSANNGNIVAVNTRTGRVIWSAPVRSSRGSVSVIRGSVFAATQDTTFVVLDAANGRVTCRRRLPARADRAGLTISGETGILTLGNGTVIARPLADWHACRS